MKDGRFYVSITNSGCRADLNKRHVVDRKDGNILCIFNPFHAKWSERDEKYLQVALNALNEESQNGTG